jgi:hypothetical protein
MQQTIDRKLTPSGPSDIVCAEEDTGTPLLGSMMREAILWKAAANWAY